MELKVWCDGIQRVVCGVSSTTTCQDVVFALAHATAQTGRFILIEKWRNNERLLAPNDHPLAVLSKWGEYANDVTFVMKRSEAKNHTLNANNNNNNSSNSNNASLSNSPSCLSTSTTSPMSSSSALSKKKLTPHIFSTSDCSLRLSSLLNGNSHSNMIVGGGSSGGAALTPTSASNTSANASPAKSMSTSHLTSHNIQRKADTANANATSTAKSKTHSQTTANSHSSSSINDTNSASKSTLLSSRPRHPPPYEEAISKSALITNNTTASHTQLTQSLLEERNNKRRSLEPSPQTQKQRTNSQKELLSSQRSDTTHRHINADMQKETKAPEKDKLTLEQQISSMERKLLENEIIIKRYKEEMTSIHQLWLEQESMITKLDQQKLEEELDSLVSEAKKYEEDVTDMKKKLSNCEGDIAECRQKIAKLMDKLEDSEKSAKIDEIERLEKEESDRLLAEQLKTAIRDKNRDYEMQKTELQTLSSSMIQLDTILQEKSTQLDKLIADMKEANIQGLALQPVDEASRFAKQSFHQRSGSTRRMVGSPRQLETAVATSKNPHGVWV